MKFLAVPCAVALGLTLIVDVRADGLCPSCGHAPRFHGQRAGAPLAGVHEPWYNMILARDKCRGRDQARQQKFWSDYYRSLSAYYGMIENMDWVSYYKHHGTPIGSVAGSCSGLGGVQMAPIYLAPEVPWGMTHNLTAPWSPPNVPWGYTPCASPNGVCPTCH